MNQHPDQKEQTIEFTPEQSIAKPLNEEPEAQAEQPVSNVKTYF